MSGFPRGGSGSGAQTGTGSPVGVVVPTVAGALYTDQSTGNVWVALTTLSSSWVLASGFGPVNTLTPSVSGTGSWQQITTASGWKLYVVTLNAWADAGQTITFTNAFTNDIPMMLGSTSLPQNFYTAGMVSKTNLILPNTTGAAVTGTLLLEGN